MRFLTVYKNIARQRHKNIHQMPERYKTFSLASKGNWGNKAHVHHVAFLHMWYMYLGATLPYVPWGTATFRSVGMMALP
jgi:hypothetical protein